MNIVME